MVVNNITCVDILIVTEEKLTMLIIKTLFQLFHAFVYSEVLNRRTQTWYNPHKRWRVLCLLHIWLIAPLLWPSCGLNTKHPGDIILFLSAVTVNKFLPYIRSSLTIPQQYITKFHYILLRTNNILEVRKPWPLITCCRWQKNGSHRDFSFLYNTNLFLNQKN